MKRSTYYYLALTILLLLLLTTVFYFRVKIEIAQKQLEIQHKLDSILEASIKDYENDRN